MTQGVRYKFNGSTFSVGTSLGGVSPSSPISAISQTDPAIITSASHGRSQADVIKIYNAGGATQFNGNLYVVDDTTTDTFSLAGEDNTNGAAYTSGGKFDTLQFSEFCELTGVNQQDAGADEIEVSTICSEAKEFEQGLSDSGTLQLDYNAAPNTTVQSYLKTAKEAGDYVAVKIVFPNSGGTIIMIGTVQSQSIQGAVNDVWKGSATIKLSGAIFVL